MLTCTERGRQKPCRDDRPKTDTAQTATRQHETALPETKESARGHDLLSQARNTWPQAKGPAEASGLLANYWRATGELLAIGEMRTNYWQVTVEWRVSGEILMRYF